MKILFVRHGDPDYELDSLTQKGDVEAKLLAERISKLKVDQFYVSPLGRAKRTAMYTLDKMGREAIECDFLAEFRATCIRPDVDREIIMWDWMPADWTKDPIFYDKDHWWESKLLKSDNAKSEYDYVVNSFDELLKNHGYVRENQYYRAEKPNNDTIVIFCHFGVTCVILSHLLGVSPMVLLHGLVAAPTSVTTVATEERQQGIASFRVSSYGDISHLYVADEPPAFAARFCECYTNEDERH